MIAQQALRRTFKDVIMPEVRFKASIWLEA